MAHFVLIFFSFCKLGFTLAEKRSVYFSITKYGYSLPGSVIKQDKAPSILDCGQKCLRHEKCLSYNYEVGRNLNEFGLCELNSEAVTTFQDESKLKYTPEFTFIQVIEISGVCSEDFCYHGGSCYFDAHNRKYRCKCPELRKGDRCEKATVEYVFTPLGSKAPNEPKDSDLSKYDGTLIKGVTMIDGFQYWKIPETGVYTLIALGGSGGDSPCNPDWSQNPPPTTGGLGGLAQGDFHFQKNAEVGLLPGQKGTCSECPTSPCEAKAGGGGGGSMIFVTPIYKAFLTAGGGGGASVGYLSSNFTSGDAGGVGGENGSRNGGGVMGDAGVVIQNASLKITGPGGGTSQNAQCTFPNGTECCSGNYQCGRGFFSNPDAPGKGGFSKSGCVCSNPGGRLGGGCGGEYLGGGGGGYSGGGITIITDGVRELGGTAGGGGSFVHSSAIPGSTVKMSGINKGDGKIIFVLKSRG